eukprot:664307-Pelagomonas_calceolata.AAC.1
MSWLNHYPGLVQVLAKFPAGSIQFQTPQHWFNAIPYHPRVIMHNLFTPRNSLLSGTHMPERH